jgi:Ca2+-binding EF-hand superfamily protein
MLADHGFFATERELCAIMNKFDRNNNGRISFTEFVDEVSPKLSGGY